ncbi:GatB/YqeY domain-containing protein [Lacibacterium aquatile]|uniref:GatB/YqeY domain-containing protein n=1 Tax=Lacibacterium aquatile TaxID=1168082 RepID=A0ABW5DK62_9PROT
MLRQQINDAYKAAMVARDQATVSAVRLIMAEFKKKDIDGRTEGYPDGVPDDQLLSLMQKMIKQRQDSITMYNQGNRPELAAKEEAEIAIIERFMPKMMSEAETDAAVAATLAEIGATSVKDMGKAMAALKEKFAGQMDFQKASAIVKKHLAGA